MTDQEYDTYGRDPQWSRTLAQQLEGPLAGLTDKKSELITEWSRLYLNTFGRESFFSSQRVRRVFEELTTLFLECLKTSDLTRYFDELKKAGKMFFDLGVPFEEVVLCIHLFQEACLSMISRGAPNPPVPMESVRMAFDELGRMGTAVFAVSYFRSVKGDWDRIRDSYQEENGQIRKEVAALERDLLSTNAKRLSAMELAVSSINRKLRQSSYQFRQIQKLTHRVDVAPDTISIMTITQQCFSRHLPDACEIRFALLDEHQLKFRVYGAAGFEAANADRIELMSEITTSQLIPEHYERLFEAKPQMILRQQVRDNARFVFPSSSLEELSEYLIIPLSRYEELCGFIWVASPEPGILTQTAAKFLNRLSKPVAGALFGLNYFSRHKRQLSLNAALEKLDEPKPSQQSFEESLDYYLEAIIKSIGVERASLMLLNPKKKSLQLFAAKGYRVYPFAGTRLGWGEGIAGSSLRDSKIICISHMRQEGRSSFSVKSLACIPLAVGRRPIGVLNLSTMSYHKTFESSEVQAANRLAQDLAEVIANRQLFSDSHALSLS